MANTMLMCFSAEGEQTRPCARISLPNESGKDFQGIPPEAGEWMRPRSGPPYDSVRCSTQNARLCLECQTLTCLRGQYNAHVFL